MLRGFCSLLFFFWMVLAVGQTGFDFDAGVQRSKISFQWVNNLIIIPVELNGTRLNFLLDTGVEETLLFSLDETDEVQFSALEKIKIKGFGALDAIDAFRADHNTLRIGKVFDPDHKVYLVLDQEINISSSVGIPVNGIIGYHFFKNFLVRIDYLNQRLLLSKTLSKVKKRKELFTKLPMPLLQNKPYITIQGRQGAATRELFQLLDTGNTDAGWLFPSYLPSTFQPIKQVSDYLGKGLSGDIYGIRGRMDSLTIGKYRLPRPIVAFPDSLSLAHLTRVDQRTGSIGNEFLRRFHVIFDYKEQQIYVRPNADFGDPFRYNMSGLEIKHQGLQWIAQEQRLDARLTYGDITFKESSSINKEKIKYQFELKPIYVVTAVRPDSPGALAGIQKGDIVLTIDKKECSSLSLDQINAFFKQYDGKTVEIELEHMGKPYKVTLVLKDLLP